jgi:long-subunit acyl-CoA synthetase (AMP-forming)
MLRDAGFAAWRRRASQKTEIPVKSPGQMAGYYKEPALTAESYTADGFFKPATWANTMSGIT